MKLPFNVERELAECHSRRGNLKFFGIKVREHESNEDTEELLRKFPRNDLKIPPEDEENIRFDRVHRLSRRASSNAQNTVKPRPIIVKLSDYCDKAFIESFIKNLKKGRSLGISDDFPKEVEDIRKELYPVLKTAKQEKRVAYFTVEKLIIDRSLYRGPERLMDVEICLRARLHGRRVTLLERLPSLEGQKIVLLYMCRVIPGAVLPAKGAET